MLPYLASQVIVKCVFLIRTGPFKRAETKPTVRNFLRVSSLKSSRFKLFFCFRLLTLALETDCCVTDH